ncbi:MAG TPA: peptidoglycan-binding protein, partial [Candidatus Paceibacterota bacterium]
MYSKKVIAGALVAAALIPALAFAQTSDTQSQIRALLEQIQTLQKQLMVLISSSGVFKPIGDQGTGIVSGKITAVASSSITVENREGAKSVTVNYTASTTIEVFNASSTPQWQAGTSADLVVGKGVAVQGTRSGENTVDATRIKVGILAATKERATNVPPGQVGKALCIALNRNLHRGSQGEDVKKLQEMLKEDRELGFNADATGVFGPLTARAMMLFQKKNGIAPADDGSVGPLTRGILMRRCGDGLGNSGHGSWNSG